MENEKNHGTEVSRRKFLQGISAGTIATLVSRSTYMSGMVVERVTSGRAGAFVQIDRSRVPILANETWSLSGGR